MCRDEEHFLDIILVNLRIGMRGKIFIEFLGPGSNWFRINLQCKKLIGSRNCGHKSLEV